MEKNNGLVVAIFSELEKETTSPAARWDALIPLSVVLPAGKQTPLL